MARAETSNDTAEGLSTKCIRMLGNHAHPQDILSKKI